MKFKNIISAMLVMSGILICLQKEAFAYFSPEMIQNNTLVKYSLAPTEIYRQNADSILYLEIQSGIGSGVIVNKDGTFITCYHAIADADFITVKAGDGQKYTVN